MSTIYNQVQHTYVLNIVPHLGIWSQNTPLDQRSESLALRRPCRQKLCIWLDRQNICPLYFPSLCPDQTIHKWMWWRAATSVFPVDICKGLQLLSDFGGILLLVKFPSKLIQPIRSVLGGWEHGCSHGNDGQLRTSVWPPHTHPPTPPKPPRWTPPTQLQPSNWVLITMA